jgi:hypothetical protein
VCQCKLKKREDNKFAVQSIQSAPDCCVQLAFDEIFMEELISFLCVIPVASNIFVNLPVFCDAFDSCSIVARTEFWLKSP